MKRSPIKKNRAKKTSRKPSRKASRKPSRKTSRKPSRKASRKPSRKAKMGMVGQTEPTEPTGRAMFLTQINNCNVVQRYEEWRNLGGTLLGERNIGCGINCLTFLGVFTRVQGEDLVRNINQNTGTSFTEMMNYVRRVNIARRQNDPSFTAYNQHLQMIPIDGDNLRHFIVTIRAMLGTNSCTIAKLMRHPFDTNNPINCRGSNLTAGHSVVLSVQQNSIYNNSLLIIDPQAMSMRTIEDSGRAFDSLREAWNRQCYTHIALMFSFIDTPINPVNQNINYAERPVPMDID
jgi:hypothetical protein